MKKLIMTGILFSLAFYLFFAFYLIPYFERRNITSIYTFACKLEKEIRIENKKFALIEDKTKWIQKKCFDFFSEPYPDIKKINKIEEKIVKSNVNLLNTKSNKYSNNSWTRSHGNNFSDKFVDIKIINKDNLQNLKEKWSFDLGTVSKKKNIETNPIYFNNKIILTDINNNLIALDPLSGKLIWEKKLHAPVARRGLTGDQNKVTIFVPFGKGVVAIDSNTGKVDKNFGIDGYFGFAASLVPPIVTKNQIFFSDVNSNVWSFNKNSGKKIWKISTKKKHNFNGAVNWGGISYDPIRNLLYVTTGNPRGYFDYIGTNRSGENLYSNSLIAINGKNGKIKWFFNDIKHDVWDLDISFPPILSSVNYKGKPIDIVSLVSKSGNILTFEREFGYRLFDYKKMNTPSSLIKNENMPNFQNIVIKPENILNHSISKNDLSVVNKKIQQNVYKQFIEGESSFFRPPEIHKEIFFNGISGGGQWPGGSINSKGVLFAHVNLIPWALSIQTKILNKDLILKNNENLNKLYLSNCSSCHGVNSDKVKIGNFDNKFVLMNSLLGITKTKYKTKNQLIQIIENKHPKYDFVNKEKIAEYLFLNDIFQLNNENIYLEPNLRIFKDQYENFATRGPWGYLIAVDLSKQEIIWKIPSGYVDIMSDDKNSIQVAGSPNWGGLLTTSTGLVISSGGYDNQINFYDQINGNLLHSLELKGMASAPPTSFKINNEQFLSVVVTGGGQRSSQKLKKIITFSLKN